MKVKNSMLLSTIYLMGGLALICFLGSCHQKIAAEMMPTTQIVFGSGGGYAGSEKEFVLLEDGKIMEKQVGGKIYKSVARIGKTTSLQHYAQCDSLQIQKMAFQQPGNIYYYMIVKRNGQENKVVWGNKDKPINDEVAQFYQQLADHLPKK